MMTRLALFAAATWAAIAVASVAYADPCGMVPPIYTGDGVPITRTGLQKTYVSYKDGVETFVIRPGYSGNVDEFGMLIPFPEPPALRKVSDNIFQQVAHAVDPPEVVIDLRIRRMMFKSARGGRALPQSAPMENALRFDEVRVVNQEAVGMYEVAVLQAGSSAALKRWMDDHEYVFPKGMDKVCDEYIEDKWCFVAMKTKVGQKDGVNPKAGQRSVKSKLPAGSTFDGNVQGMGFRFRTEELVVPMRLSAFNEGDTRNIVYLLTEGPKKIRAIPEEYVVRQISGEELYRHLTEPLPLRVIGGTEKDIPEYQRRNLPKLRDPKPKNGVAAELFASDLLAASSEELALPSEEREKSLLNIGEELGLRGAEIDRVNSNALTEERAEVVEKTLAEVKKMTLTVVDGDFPREVISSRNLTFGQFEMPKSRNTRAAYSAANFGPQKQPEGVLIKGKLAPLPPTKKPQSPKSRPLPLQRFNSFFTPQSNDWNWALTMTGLAIAAFGAVFVLRSRNAKLVAWFLVGFAIIGASTAVLADDAKPTIRELLRDLSDAKKASSAVEQLVVRGDEAKEQLMGEAIEGGDLTRRGWAIVALGEIGGEDVDALLTKVHSNDKQPELVRTWAAAARVAMTDSADGLIAKANLVGQFPALGRPIGMRLVEELSDPKSGATPEGIVSVTLQVPQLQQALAPAILALGSDKLTTVMISAKDQNVRRQATAYLGALSQQGDKEVPAKVIKAYAFDADAEDVPWAGGPLFLPGIQWEQAPAKELTT
ncbi:MAG: DUF2330 domain-containing protein, partial [bacterium]|nr:DUF2330 domain-containing protein [bacterium]